MKNALITGASSGIGLALSREFASRGYRVAMLARRTDVLEREAAGIIEKGHEAMAVTCDVAVSDSVMDAVAHVVDAWGPLDLAIANAGIGNPTPATQFKLERDHKVMAVNFGGMLNLYHATVPAMVERKSGQFAGIASLAGFRGLPLSSMYSASKSAMQAFLQSVRIELTPLGVGVATINPGFVKTPQTDMNTIPMPFIMSAEKAAKIIADGLEKGKREITFPFPMAMGMRILSLLPNRLYDAISAGTAKKQKI